MLTPLLKGLAHSAGLTVERRDPLVEQIPANYERSEVLPVLSARTLTRVRYFTDMLTLAQPVDGDLVECGVSVGHGLLTLILLSETMRPRTYYGYDSFAGFPAPSHKDVGTAVPHGYYASAPELVVRVLTEGGIEPSVIRERVRLVRGLFDDTLHQHTGPIALLHVDGDLYESTRVVLDRLYDRVRRGGVILFDDYGVTDWPGATSAIDEFFSTRAERLVRHACGKYYTVKT